MPELPEVETVMRGLSPVLMGRSIAGVELRRAGLRFPFPTGFAARLKGRQVVGLQRRAKYILVNLDDGHCLLVHLGMTGRFTVLDENARPNNLGEFYFEQGADGAGSGPHDHVVFLLDNGVQIVYTDVGRSIAGVELRRAGLRFPFPAGFAARLKGRHVVGLQRRAKYILVNLDDGHCLLVHLGMTGRFTVLDKNARPNNLGEFYFEPGAAGAGSGPHDHVVITLDNGVRVIYTDHRRFGVMDLLHENEMASHKLLKDIGVEPLGNEFSADFLAGQVQEKIRTPESRPA